MKSLVAAGLLSVALFSPAASGQQNIAYNLSSNPIGSSGNAFPWFSEGVRYQAIMPHSLFGGPAIIQDLYTSGRTSRGNYEIVYSDIEIKMGLTTLSVPTTNWAANNPSPVAVYRGPLRVQIIGGKWRPIGLPTSYSFAPTSPADNLCIEVIVWSVADKGGGTGNNFNSGNSEGSLMRAFKYQWTSNTSAVPLTGTGGIIMGLLLDGGNFVTELGEGCQGSSGKIPVISHAAGVWPKPGSVFPVELIDGPSASVAVLNVGFSDLATGFPVDLGLIGAPTCFLWHEIIASVPFATGLTGSASLPLPIPANPNIIGTSMLASWVMLDPAANAIGVTTSDYARVKFGN